MKQTVFDLTKEDRLQIACEATERAIEEIHAAGRPSTHSDDSGVYHLFPDGHKEYIQLYEQEAETNVRAR